MPDREELLTRLREHLVRRGLKYTRPREEIFLAFMRVEGHVSAEELHRRVRERGPDVGLATVHRALKLLVEEGFAVEHRFGGRRRRFEPALRKQHHDHLICTACGRIVEFAEVRIERLQAEVAARHGFSITDHRLELFGVCGDCRR